MTMEHKYYDHLTAKDVNELKALSDQELKDKLAMQTVLFKNYEEIIACDEELMEANKKIKVAQADAKKIKDEYKESTDPIKDTIKLCTIELSIREAEAKNV